MKNKTSKMPNGFRLIPSFPRYGVDENGAVFSLITGRLKKSWVNMHGYMEIGLQNQNNKTIFRRVHVLVAEAFISVRPQGMLVCHNDGNPLNNNFRNLRYDTAKGNIADREKHRNYKHSQSKLTSEQIEYIKQNYKRIRHQRSNAAELAEKFKVSKATITNLIRGKTYSKIFDIKYAELAALESE